MNANAVKKINNYKVFFWLHSRGRRRKERHGKLGARHRRKVPPCRELDWQTCTQQCPQRRDLWTNKRWPQLPGTWMDTPGNSEPDPGNWLQKWTNDISTSVWFPGWERRVEKMKNTKSQDVPDSDKNKKQKWTMRLKTKTNYKHSHLYPKVEKGSSLKQRKPHPQT